MSSNIYIYICNVDVIFNMERKREEVPQGIVSGKFI